MPEGTIIPPTCPKMPCARFNPRDGSGIEPFIVSYYFYKLPTAYVNKVMKATGGGLFRYTIAALRDGKVQGMATGAVMVAKPVGEVWLTGTIMMPSGSISNPYPGEPMLMGDLELLVDQKEIDDLLNPKEEEKEKGSKQATKIEAPKGNSGRGATTAKAGVTKPGSQNSGSARKSTASKTTAAKRPTAKTSTRKR